MIFLGGLFSVAPRHFSSALFKKADGENSVCTSCGFTFYHQKNIDAGDHILQCDGIPGPVSTAKQPATDVDREKCEAR